MNERTVRTEFDTRKSAIAAACSRLEETSSYIVSQLFVWDHGAHVPRSRRYTLQSSPPTYGPFFGPIRRANLAAYRADFGIPAASRTSLHELDTNERAYLLAALDAYRSTDSERGPILRPVERDELARNLRDTARTTSAAYVVQGTVTTVDAQGWSCTRQIPTFYLLANVQGITDEEHAAKVARSVVDPSDILADDAVSLSVARVEL